jgi:ssDNA-binding Zn-finger/Zn-ribbon topoisomerase 1
MTGAQPAAMESHVIVRDPCPECGTAMLLERIERDQSGHDLRTFECPQCKQSKRDLQMHLGRTQ